MFEIAAVKERLNFLAPGFAFAKTVRELPSLPGLDYIFGARDDIQILVSSVGFWECKDSALPRLKNARNVAADDMLEALAEKHGVGDFQYLPYSSALPILHGGLQASTLFTLDDIVQRVTAGTLTSVVVVAPCPKCGLTKAKALLPLLRNSFANH